MYFNAKEISKDKNNFFVLLLVTISKIIYFNLILKSKNKMQCEGTNIIFPIDINEFDEIFFYQYKITVRGNELKNCRLQFRFLVIVLDLKSAKQRET